MHIYLYMYTPLLPMQAHMHTHTHTQPTQARTHTCTRTQTDVHAYTYSSQLGEGWKEAFKLRIVLATFLHTLKLEDLPQLLLSEERKRKRESGKHKQLREEEKNTDWLLH